MKAAGGPPLVKGKKITAFTNTKEEAVSFTEGLPFLVDDMLKENGRNGRKASAGSHMCSPMAS